MKLGVVGPDGALALPSSVPTPHDPAALADVIAREVAALRVRHPAAAAAPVGIAVPGILDERRGVVERAMNLGWQDVPIGDLVRERIPGPVVIGHDVRAGALAESAWGAGRLYPQDPRTGLADLVFVPIGTGVAAAVIHDGRIFGDRYTGDIGQVEVLEPFTGRRTRLERVAAASAIARRWSDRHPELEPATARSVVDRARAGDRDAEQVLFSALDTLAQALATIVSGVGPLPVVIGGGLGEGGAVVIDTLHESIAHRLGVIPAPPVVPATLGMWAGCLGAAHLALHAEEQHPRGEAR